MSSVSPTHQDLSNDTTYSQIKSRVPVPFNKKLVSVTLRKFSQKTNHARRWNFVKISSLEPRRNPTVPAPRKFCRILCTVHKKLAFTWWAYRCYRWCKTVRLAIKKLATPGIHLYVGVKEGLSSHYPLIFGSLARWFLSLPAMFLDQDQDHIVYSEIC